MLSFFKKRREAKAAKAADAELTEAARQSGYAAGEAMFDTVHRDLDLRISVVAENLLAVLKERLSDITGPGENLPASTLCKVELEIFLEHAKKFTETLIQESEIRDKAWYDLAEGSGVGDLFRSTVTKKLSDASLELILAGTSVTGERILELEKAGHK